MANLKQLKKKALEQTPTIKDISDVQSLESDNFVYSLLINTRFGQEIQGFSVVELSSWLKDKGITNDYQLYKMLFGGI